MATQEPENRNGAAGADAAEGSRVEALRRRLAEDPRSLAFVSLADELNRIGEFEEAATVAQRGLLSHPDSVAGRLALAVAEAERDHVKEALEQIKRALIIDQENPKALALMGRILLKRGLAKRAVQFLSHAVKLAPTNPSYGELLQEARRQAGQSLPPTSSPPQAAPVFTAESVPAEGDPWTDGDGGAEHTVFDDGAINRVPRGSGTGLRATGDVKPGEEETAFQHPLPKPGGARARNAKVGGSAAEYSQMMHRGQIPDDVLEGEGEPTVSGEKAPLAGSAGHASPADGSRSGPPASSPASPPPPPPPVGASADVESKVPRAPSVVRALENARREAAGSGARSAPKGADGSAAGAAPGPDQPDAAAKAALAAAKAKKAAKAAETAAKAEDAKAKKANPKAKKVDPKPPGDGKSESGSRPDKRVGPVATRMVDDALWVLFGKKGAAEDAEPSSATDDVAADGEGSGKKAPVRAKLKARAAPVEAHQAPRPRVVRTSERFGTWAQVATMTVLSVAGALVGHWVMLSSAGPGPEVASEEVKGLASDLERGGLAALLAAEEKANELARSAPDLVPLLNGVKAEIYGRRWRDFGGDPEMRAKAVAAVDALEGRRPTVEHLAGLVALSTTAEAREPVLDALRALEREYPESPKIHVLQARLHEAAGRERAALNALFEARARYKHHRATMLELARWYRRAGAAAEALGTYQQLLQRYPLDVEAAIERYVLGQMTGKDPDDAESVAGLAGLVRNEDPAVAKDETGRAALAFAVPLFARGQLVEGIEELGKAERAFARSPAFKRAVAGAYLAVGEFGRAEKLYERALEVAPGDRRAALGLARARYAQAAGFKVDLTRQSERIAKRFKARRTARTGVARLPLGILGFRPGRFELVEFLPDPSIFPEDAYERAETLEALLVTNQVALGDRALRRGEVEEAIRRFESSLGLKPTPQARFGLGRALLAKGEHAEAVRALKVGLAQKTDDIPGRIALARALLARGQSIDALDALEPLERSAVVAPDGLMMLGRLRTERGDYEDAVGPLETVAELRPQDAAAQMAYGEVLHRLRRSDEALAAFDAAAQLDSELSTRDDLSAVALTYLGRAELERSKRKGVALLKRALKHEDVPVEAHFYLGRALRESRRTRRQGKRELRRFVRVGPAGDMRDEAERLLRRR